MRRKDMSLNLWPKPKSAEGGRPEERSQMPDATPIEPESTTSTTLSVFKWVLFMVVFLYVLLSYFHGPILTQLGNYLVVQHPVAKSDLIVCLAGGEVERSLASADLFARGAAPRIFIARERIPDGLETLKQRGVAYPESIDLVAGILRGLGVPDSAVIRHDQPVESTFQEAESVATLIQEKHYRSLILVTSPTHSRRAWLTFRKAIPDHDIRILVVPTPYSKFRAEDWWNTRSSLREVIVEYQKLIYYKLKGLL
jgi:uncharacterized SAM-binding protein YcdF (DUF218 family)